MFSRCGQLVCSLLVALMLVIAILSSSRAVGIEPASDIASVSPGNDIAVRNIYVPADEITAWPTDGKAYLPIKADRLESLLESASAANDQASAPRVEQTVLYASLDPQHRLVGRGSMQCEVTGSEPVWLSLQSARLGVRSGTWRDTGRPARLGYWGAGRGLAVEVPASDRLDFDWHSLPRNPNAATDEFRLAIPFSLVNYLLLDLPAGQAPDVTGSESAMVLGPEEWDSAMLPEGALAPSLPPVAPDKGRWLVRWGSGESLRLRVRTLAEPAPNELQMASYQEQLVYRVQESGVELRQQFDITGTKSLPRLLSLLLTPGLVIRSVEWDGRPVEPRTRGTEAYELSLPATASGVRHELVIEAWHPMAAGAITPLPQVTLPQLFWTSGKVRVLLDPALQVADLAARNTVQVSAGGAPNRQTLQFEKWSSRGRVELAVATRPATNTVQVGRVLQLDSLGTSATVTTNWRSSSATPVRLLVAKLKPEWQIQVVTALAPFTVDDWYVDRTGKDDLLVVRTSVDPQLAGSSDAIRLTVDASRPAAANMGWQPIVEFDVLEWQDARLTRSWTAINVEDGYQLETVPPQPPLDMTIVAASVAELLPGVVDAIVYDRMEVNDNLQLHLAAAAPRVSARVVTTVEDRQKTWSLSHRIELVPESSSIELVDLLMRGAKTDAIRWRLAGEEEWQTSTAEAGFNRGRTEAVNSGLFRLELPRRQSGPLTIEVQNNLLSGASCTPPTLEVEGASELEEWVEVRSPNARDIRVEASGWQLSQRQSPGDVPLQSAWLASTRAPGRKLVVSRGGAIDGLPLASIASASLASTYLPQAPSQHRLTLAVDNTAERQLLCTLPSGATKVRWHRLGEVGSATNNPTSEKPQAADERTLALPLTGSDGPEQFIVDYIMPSEQLTHGEMLRAPWPLLGLPVEVATWDLAVPSDYRIENYPRADRPADWRTRLFGPLVARPELERPWRSGDRADGTLHRVSLPVGNLGDASVKVVHQPTTEVRLALVLLLSAIASYWLWQRMTWLVVAIAISFMAALLLPTPTYQWATAVWGGAVLAVALRLLELATRTAWQAWSAGSSARMSTATVRTLVVLAMLVTQSTIAAAPAPVIESVLVPVDANGRIASDERYLSAKFLGELLRREEQRFASESWVVSKPRYTGSLSSAASAAGATASVGRWTAAMDLEVLRAPATIGLPFEQTDAAWSDIVQVDGLPVPLRWSSDGHYAEFDVTRTGKFRLRFEFQPLIRYAESTWSVQLTVPPLPGGELVLDATSIGAKLRVDGLEVPTPAIPAEAAGIPLRSDSQLLVEWPQLSLDVVTEPPSVERWEWLEVASDTAVIEGVFKFAATDLPPAKLSLLADGLPLIATSTDVPNTGCEWRLLAPLEPMVGDDGTAEVRFRLACDRSTRFGRLRLPDLALVGTTIDARYLAVSESPELAIVVGGLPATDVQSLASLSQLWIERDEPSQLVRLDRTAGPVVATIRPTVHEVTPEESLDVLAIDNRLEVLYRGSFDYSGVEHFSQLLSISPEFKNIDSVEVLDGESSRPVDFSRAAPDRLLVLYTAPPTGAVELRISGHVDLKKETSGRGLTADVPRITAALDAAITQQVALFAADDLIAQDIQGEVEPELTGTAATPPEGWQAYGVKSLLTSSDRSTPLVVLVQPNEVKLDTDILTTLVRRDNSWIAEFAVLVDVTEGNLPELEIEWPAELVGTPEADGPVSLDATLEQSTGGRRLKLRLDNVVAAGNRLRLALRSAVRLDSPNRLECPMISVRGSSTTDRYFGLLEDDLGEWTWQRAEPSVAPASIEGLLTAWPSARLLKATSSTMPVGVWTAHASDDRQLQLPLATIDVRQTATDDLIVQTKLVLPALEVDAFEIALPPHRELIDVTVDGRSALVTRAGENRLRLVLPDPQLPHVLQVTTEHRAPDASGSIEIPQLFAAGRPCEVQHRLWRMRGLADDATFGGPQVETLPAVDLAVLELNQLLSAGVGSGVRADRRLPREWATEWTATLSRAEQALRDARDAAAPVDPVLVTPDGTKSEYDELLARATAEILRTRTAADLATIGTTYVPTESEANDPVQQFVQSDSKPLRWMLLRRDATDPLVRWAMALGGVLLAGVFVVARSRWRWPLDGYETLFPVVVLLGLAWWFCLWPRTLGLVLAGLAIIAWLRWNYIKRRRQSSDTSSWFS